MFELIANTKELDEVSAVFRDSSLFDFNLAGAKPEIETIVGQALLANFLAKGARGGHPAWPLIKTATAKQKARLNYGGKQTLERTGALKEALIHPQVVTEDGGRRLVVKFTGDHADLIGIHQNAKGSEESGLPARATVFLAQEDRDRISQAALTSLTNNFSKRLKARR